MLPGAQTWRSQVPRPLSRAHGASSRTAGLQHSPWPPRPGRGPAAPRTGAASPPATPVRPPSPPAGGLPAALPARRAPPRAPLRGAGPEPRPCGRLPALGRAGPQSSSPEGPRSSTGGRLRCRQRAGRGAAGPRRPPRLQSPLGTPSFRVTPRAGLPAWARERPAAGTPGSSRVAACSRRV